MNATTHPQPSRQPPARASRTPYYYKLFRVKRADGRVTTVSMDPVLVAKACQVLGGLPEVGQIVRNAALRYEPGLARNCSHYAAGCLRDALTGAVDAVA